MAKSKRPRGVRPRAAQVLRLPGDEVPARERRAHETSAAGKDDARCSFCGRGPESYRAAARGPAGVICDVCLGQARALVDGTPPGGDRGR